MDEEHSAAYVEAPCHVTPAVRERLTFLDWVRFLMVLAVVFAHTTKSGITRNQGLNKSWLVDDATLWEEPGYQSLWRNRPDKTGPSAYEGRFVSIVRPWCLPLLFWISGAAVACAYKGGRPTGALKLVLITIIGMLSNAALWFLGPMDDTCYVGNMSCADKGILFNFTVVLWAGPIFAVLFQMWYTIVLLILQYLNWPLLAVIAGNCRPWALGLQWAMNVAMYSAMVLGGESESPRLVLVLSACLEAVFLATAWLSSVHPNSFFPDLITVRFYHYVLAAVSVIQFAALPYADQMTKIDLPYLAYIVTGFNRFYDLGFIMTRARRDPGGDKALPLASRAWPLVLIAWVLTAPSTNWEIAGLLTYPYFRKVSDRCLYVAGAMIVIFAFDRGSRGTKCVEIPGFLQNAGLFLYVFHPWLITLLISFGLRSVVLIVVLVDLAAFGLLGVFPLARYLAAGGLGSVTRICSEPEDSSNDDEEDDSSE